jgi:hypothetical protein
MLRFLSRLWKQNVLPARSTTPRALRRARLEVETLEGRLVPSGTSIFTNQLVNPLLRETLTVNPSQVIPVFLETPNERFVDHVYSDLFHSSASSQTIVTLGTKLDQGQMTRIDVVRSFTFTQAYGQVVVQDLFQSMLGRAYNPTTDLGLVTLYLSQLPIEGNSAPWLGASALLTATRETVAASIATTPEYVQARGGGTVDGWLNALFADALHRAPTPAERALYAPAGVSLSTALTVFQGQEHQVVELNDFYEHFLHRPLDTVDTPNHVSGKTYWLGRYQTGVWTEEILAEMLASNEYYQICQG